jgi:hypothetical protein
VTAVGLRPVEDVARHLGAPGSRALVDSEWKHRLRFPGKATLEIRDRREVAARRRWEEQAQDLRERAVRDGRPVVGVVGWARHAREAVEYACEATPLDPRRDRLVKRDARVPERARGDRWAKARRRPHESEREVEPDCRHLRAVRGSPGPRAPRGRRALCGSDCEQASGGRGGAFQQRPPANAGRVICFRLHTRRRRGFDRLQCSHVCSGWRGDPSAPAALSAGALVTSS